MHPVRLGLCLRALSSSSRPVSAWERMIRSVLSFRRDPASVERVRAERRERLSSNGASLVLAEDLVLDTVVVESRLVKGNAVVVKGCSDVGGVIECSSLLAEWSPETAGQGVLLGEVDCIGMARTIGRCAVLRDLKAGQLSSVGSLDVEGDIECERLSLRGRISARNVLVADNCDILLRDGISSAIAIKGREIVIRRAPEEVAAQQEDKAKSWWARLRPSRIVKREAVMDLDEITGEQVSIEACKVLRVSGVNVVVGPLCEIHQLEHSGTLTIDKSSRVESIVNRSIPCVLDDKFDE